MQKTYVVVASVNLLGNLKLFLADESRDVEFIIVDEGDENIRESNKLMLEGERVRFYGPGERKEWFGRSFGSSSDQYFSVIPERCHAETSFGFLVALQEDADFVVELDDDVFPVDGHAIIDSHIRNLDGGSSYLVKSGGKWYNTLENLEVRGGASVVYPRGHPYQAEARTDAYSWQESVGESVLNMGLWLGNPDLDALTIVANGGLDGRCEIEGIGMSRNKVVVGNGVYLAICSMNTGFRTKIVPAFYQLYMRYAGIDRFDDIWSGLFLKKVADHLGDSVSLGAPLVRHQKRPRNSFKDLRAELEGIVMNETLWRVVDSVELEGKDYLECYRELSSGLRRSIPEFAEKLHRDFITITCDKMELWTTVVEKLT